MKKYRYLEPGERPEMNDQTRMGNLWIEKSFILKVKPDAQGLDRAGRELWRRPVSESQTCQS